MPASASPIWRPRAPDLPASAAPAHLATVDALAGFVAAHPRLVVLTGAGVSTDSGLPAYRDADGRWRHAPPVFYQDFVRDAAVRRRYWARSVLGWPRFTRARPNAAHRALARLEAAGVVRRLVTQNVDGLHQRAGSRRVIDLHGRLDTVECLGCHRPLGRDAVQEIMVAANPAVLARRAVPAPDGDTALEGDLLDGFRVPACPACRGVLKPAVVFFGESIPRARVDRARASLEDADALLVVGSSLTVLSAYRFCAAARARTMPIAAVNLGRTRADAELALRVPAPCGEVLPELVRRLVTTSEEGA